MTNEEAIAAILADYRRELERHHIDALVEIVAHYGLLCRHDRQSYIDALVEHFRQQLLKGEKP